MNKIKSGLLLILLLFFVGCNDSSIELSFPKDFEQTVLFDELPQKVKYIYTKHTFNYAGWVCEDFVNLDSITTTVDCRCNSQKHIQGCFLRIGNQDFHIRPNFVVLYKGVFYKTFDAYQLQNNPMNSNYFRFKISDLTEKQ
jgi:hypothetical protein